MSRAAAKITLYEVAARAGVSIATVSRALNGLAVSPAVSARVREAATALGYVANEAARALRSDRTMTMGLIFHDLRNTLGIELVDAIGETIEADGYSLLIASARADAGRYDQLMRRFLERRVDALFCVDPHGDGESCAQYAAAGAPLMALFGAGEAYGDLPLMTPSYSKATAALAAHLSDLGHARVAIVADEERSDALIAIGDALAAGSIEVDWIEPSEAGGMGDLVGGLMARASRPTAVIVRDATSWGLLAACADARLHIPNDFSLISVGELADDARRAEHGVSALVIDPNHIGRAAARAMLTWLAGSRPAPRVPVQAAIWEPRATTGPALRLVWRAEA